MSAEKAVEAAISKWTDIAEQWHLVRIPEYMDNRSLEYEKYRRHIDDENKQREYREYLRLKKKFENR